MLIAKIAIILYGLFRLLEVSNGWCYCLSRDNSEYH